MLHRRLLHRLALPGVVRLVLLWGCGAGREGVSEKLKECMQGVALLRCGHKLNTHDDGRTADLQLPEVLVQAVLAPGLKQLAQHRLGGGAWEGKDTGNDR